MAMCLLMFFETMWRFFRRTKSFSSVSILYIVPFIEQCSFLPFLCFFRLSENDVSESDNENGKVEAGNEETQTTIGNETVQPKVTIPSLICVPIH